MGGGRWRERALLGLLRVHYASRFRRQWLWSAEPPHFFEHRISAFNLFLGRGEKGVYAWFRAFYVAEIVREGDTLLDIGCGDGFFTARFYAPRCRAVDAIDVEADAIAAASAQNPAPNVRYRVQDAVREPFPGGPYDVVVWDSAIGHFDPDAARTVLEKIATALTPGGVFCGSESLGSSEGHDHLQFFEEFDSLASVLRQHFPHVHLREITYPIRGRQRREAFWRCAVDPERLREASWLHVGASSSAVEARAG